MMTALIVAAVVVALYVMLNMKTSRSDGKFVGYVHPYRRMMWYIMPTRNESVVYFDTPVRAEKLLQYLEATKDRFHCDVTHCLVGACVITAVKQPKMNQFVVGKRLYERAGSYVTFSMKREKKNKEAKISAVKIDGRPGETFRGLCDRINGNIKVERSDAKTYQDKEFNLLLALPRPLLTLGVAIFRWLDYHNILPGSFIKTDPFYTTIFIANLGSVDMAPGYHHLYEWGTCPLFMMVGKVEERAMVRDGQVVVEKILPVRWSYDERIDDGLTARHGIDGVRTVLEDPFTWLGCLDEQGADAKPLQEKAA